MRRHPADSTNRSLAAFEKLQHIRDRTSRRGPKWTSADLRRELVLGTHRAGAHELTMPLEPGTTLGPYAVTAKIGEGGMGEVYRARDTKLDRDVALKVLPQAFTDDPDRLARFEREAKVLCPAT